MVTLAKSAIEKFNVNIRGLEATVQETNQRVAAGSNGVLDAAAAGDENREGAEKLFRKLTGRKAKTASMVAPHASNPGIAATLAFASIALNNSIDSGPAPAPAKLVAKKKPSVKNKRKSSWWWFLMNFRLDQVNWSDIFANAAKVAMNPSNVASGGMGAAVGSSVFKI